MTADPWSEDARGIWQSQESVVTRMSADDMRARADRWNRELDGTNWIAFACAGFLLIFFVWMLVVHQRTLPRLGAIVGIASAAYLTGADGSTTARPAFARTRRSWSAGGRPMWARRGRSC
jgi:hypothetical protein